MQTLLLVLAGIGLLSLCVAFTARKRRFAAWFLLVWLIVAAANLLHGALIVGYPWRTALWLGAVVYGIPALAALWVLCRPGRAPAVDRS